MKINSDHIPEVIDDLLGRNNIATEIVNGLVSYSKRNKDGIAISITGEWGIGKSTLIDYIRKQLTEKEQERFKKGLTVQMGRFNQGGEIEIFEIPQAA